jgi:hypothetical protein
MTNVPTTWQAALLKRYPHLFDATTGCTIHSSGFSEIGCGWQNLLETAVGRIAVAVVGQPAGTLRIGQIKSKYGTLRIYLDGRVDPCAQARADEAVALACARSACTCEKCGRLGRLYDGDGWLVTSCNEHAVGRPVEVRAVLQNIHIVRGSQDGRAGILTCSRYDRDSDLFTPVAPSALGLEE